MIPPAVAQYLLEHQDQQLAKLFELLCIPSLSTRRDSACDHAANWLLEYMQSLGLGARLVKAGKPIVLAEVPGPAGAPTVLIYGHYDVQPPEPLELWESPPFEPVVRDGFIYARGANDDKGQLFTHLMALEAYMRTGTPLPVGVKVLLEGEEEVGSPTLESFLSSHAEWLRCDTAVISDSEFFAPGVPSITYALRGINHFELTVEEASHDVHSGIHGGALRNPIHVLCDIISAMHGPDGRVTIDGFYDDVRPLADAERQAWKKLPFDERQYAQSLGVEDLGGGEAGYSVLERRWARPTLDINGMTGGYTGPGGKTIIPAKASAKISFRLVGDQEPQKILEGLEAFIARHSPPGIKTSMEIGSANRPVTLQTNSPAMQAAQKALRETFGGEVAMIRCGASVPVTEMFQRMLGMEAVMMGFGLPDDRLHSPNERFSLDQLFNGARASAAFLQNLGCPG